SKSISGYGLPMAVTLVRPEHDVFDPGEHNGTFRGHNPAFITATCALDHWRDGALAGGTHKRAGIIAEALNRMAQSCPELKPEVRGRGLMQGLALDGDGLAEQVSHEAFRRGVILETSGPASEVAKIMPPLTIPLEALSDGLGRVAEAVDTVAMNARSAHARVA
ncbi:MAG: aminotransferase class III-fold pyridoxal phosphate-dependent enzyme, partial [Alphaproteobacteria bacterium]